MNALDTTTPTWEFTGLGGQKRFITQQQYAAQPLNVKKWYRPICPKCGPADAASPARVAADLALELLVRSGRVTQEQVDSAIGMARAIVALGDKATTDAHGEPA